MTVREVSIKDIGNIRDLTFKASQVTVISGSNGEGKTNILRALQAPFEGGHHPELIRRGCDRGEIRITLSDGKTIALVVTPKESKLTIKALDGSIVPKPATFVKQLAAGFAFDPIAMIAAPVKDRVKFLLEAMPLEFHPTELDEACGGDSRVTDPLDLQGMNNFLAGREDMRTDTNRRLKQLDGYIQTTRSSLPDDDEIDWRVKHAELSDQLEAARKEVADLVSQAKVDTNLLTGEIREKLAASIDEIKAEAQRKIDDATAAAQAEQQRIQALAGKTLAEMRAPIDERIEQLAGEVAAAEVRSAAQLKAKGQREMLAKLERDRKALLDESLALDGQIDALRKLKQRKLEALPVKGVEVRDGRIYVDGLDFDTQLNTAAQYALCFELASLKLGSLPFVICDRAESMDTENFRMLVDGAKQAGLQLAVTRVTEGELQVTAA